METPVEPVWSIRKVGGGVKEQEGGEGGLFVWVKRGKEMKGACGKVTGVCADAPTVEESVQ